MGKYLVQYVHVEETTYEEWIEADSAEEAIKKVDNCECNFNEDDVTEVQGLEIKDIEVIEEEEE